MATNFPGCVVAVQLWRQSAQLQKSSYGGGFSSTKKDRANKGPSSRETTALLLTPGQTQTQLLLLLLAKDSKAF